MLRRLYDWTMNLAGHRRAVPALAAVSFIESSVFPIPPDVLLIPMVLADRAKASGVEVELTIWEDMIHVWPIFAPVLPEGQQAIDRIGDFVRQHTNDH